jgi:hypothetical protein
MFCALATAGMARAAIALESATVGAHEPAAGLAVRLLTDTAVATTVDGVDVGGADPTPTATSRPTPTSANAHLPDSSGGGCQTAPAPAGGTWLILGGLLLALRRSASR